MNKKPEKNFKLKSVIKKINTRKFNSLMIEFILWFSKYNLAPLGMSLKMCLLNKDVLKNLLKKKLINFELQNIKTNFIKYRTKKITYFY